MNKSLVFVLGAGSSHEVNLPVGEGLKNQISKVLTQLSTTFPISYVCQAFLELKKEEFPSKTNEHLHDFNKAARRIKNAMPQAISIDNFIESHRHEHDIKICAKLAIAQCILAAEKDSLLYISREKIENKIDFRKIEHTWFNSVFQLITESCSFNEIKERLSRIAFINFNYDRCIDHYLFEALENFYSEPKDSVSEAMKELKILHAYGSVGELPWQPSTECINFGADFGAKELIDASKRIRTFTEGTDSNSSDIQEIRQVIQQAERLVFLGFAFHPLNLSLLSEKSNRPSRRPIFATALNISDSDVTQITRDLSRHGLTSESDAEIAIRNDLNCAKLFKEYGRSIRLP
jgi:hypothetical protein